MSRLKADSRPHPRRKTTTSSDSPQVTLPSMDYTQVQNSLGLMKGEPLLTELLRATDCLPDCLQEG